jgi:hypothetical protein
VTPIDIEAEILFAESVALGDRDAASLCSKEQEALRARLIQNAVTIDRLVGLLKMSNFVAKLNHDTIKNRRIAI